ncbi:hypothetical protein R6Q59_007759 [Mikania micrantha]
MDWRLTAGAGRHWAGRQGGGRRCCCLAMKKIGSGFFFCPTNRLWLDIQDWEMGWIFKIEKWAGNVSERTSKYAKTGCNDTCGNVRIPYPFGIGDGCSANEWYIIDCNYSKPYQSALNHLEVLDVNLENQTVTVGTPMITNCQNPVRNSSEIMGVDLGRSPFLFSKAHNKFVFQGSCGHQTLDQVTCCYQADDEERVIVDMIDGTTVDAWECRARSYHPLAGNLYLRDGCVYNDGVSVIMGVVFLVAFSFVMYKWIKQAKEKRQRKRFFKRNGGLLLKQQEETDPSLVDKTIHFTSRELRKATNNFNENRILGRGGQGTVYKGMLVDGRIGAVKKSKIVDESQLEHFINEMVILSQINHRNMVKLLGCCLETEVPVLVSEFIPNGTLYDRLHNEADEFPISLDIRLQIATEVAGAIAYLHSATSIPIYHRDVKTTNILLDEKYKAKVSNFGTSSQFTEKSDVYSFGIVLVELLTGERPISLTRFGENRNLATHFMLAMEEGQVMFIFDEVVIKEGPRDELLILANLAMRCLNLSGKYRPTMKEVSIELEIIRWSHIPSMVQSNIGLATYAEELSMPTFGESSSTFLSFNESIDQ